MLQCVTFKNIKKKIRQLKDKKEVAGLSNKWTVSESNKEKRNRKKSSEYLTQDVREEGENAELCQITQELDVKSVIFPNFKWLSISMEEFRGEVQQWLSTMFQ